jgi:hypothetical protein
MPSRKKAKGQARKAAKAKNKAAEKLREAEESFRALEQAQIQRLQISNQYSVLPLCSCLHGFVPFSNDDICIKFIRAFIHEYYKCLHNTYKAGRKDEMAVIVCLLQMRESTQDEYSEVWNDAAKLKQVISYFSYNGTMHILADADGYARHSAMLGRFFEEWLKVRVHKYKAFIDWPKVMECGIALCDKHSRVKYFWRRIRCSCLDEKYEEVKSITKMGLCFNHHCTHPKRIVERRKLRCCSRCRSVTYCSRECQVADWSDHKEFCDEVVATRAEFDASQQQQY